MSEQTHTSESRTQKHTKASESHSKDAPRASEASSTAPAEEAVENHFVEAKSDDIVAKAATIAVVGVGVALISTELLPGMLIGVAAAMLPGIGPKMRPFLKSTLKAGFSAVRKTREMLAEASEQVQDMMAEAQAEDAAPPAAGNSHHA